MSKLGEKLRKDAEKVARECDYPLEATLECAEIAMLVKIIQGPKEASLIDNKIIIGKGGLHCSLGGAYELHEFLKESLGEKYSDLHKEFLKKQDKILGEFCKNVMSLLNKKISTIYTTETEYEKYVFDPDGAFDTDDNIDGNKMH